MRGPNNASCRGGRYGCDSRLRLRLRRAHVYGKFSNSISYDHQLILRHVLALDYCLQVQQRLESCLFTSIKWILCKFRLLRNDQLLDIIFQLVYAYARLRSAIDFPPRRLLLVRGIWPSRRNRLRCCTMGNRMGALWIWLVMVNKRELRYGDTYVDRLSWIRLLLSIRSGKRRLLRRRLVSSSCRGSGCFSTGCGLAATEELLLPLEAVLVGGEGYVPRSNQGVLDRPDLLNREDRLCRDGARHRFLPSLEHLVHLSPCAIVDLGVGTHENRVKFGTEV